MVPPGGGLSNQITINGRVYTSDPLTPINIPSFDALVAEANGWIRISAFTGASSSLNAPSTTDYKTFSGSGLAPGSTVTVYKNNVSAGTAIVAVDGTWSFTFTTAPAAQSSITYSGVPESPAITIPNSGNGTSGPLATLSLSPLTGSAGVAYSGAIAGVTAGSTIVAASSDGTALIVNGTSVTGTFPTGGTKSITLTETLAGAANSPNLTIISLTITAVSGPTLVPLTVSPLTITAGSVFSGAVTGSTAGSTISATSSDGIAVNSYSNSRVTANFPTAGSKTVTITETLAGATNSPKVTTQTINVTASGAPNSSTPFTLSRIVNVAGGGTSLTALGHSWTAVNISGVSNVYANTRYARGYTCALMLYLGWNYTPVRTYAVSGYTLSLDLGIYNGSRTTDAPVLRYGAIGSDGWNPDIFLFEGGSNDISGGSTFSQMQTDAAAAQNYVLGLAQKPRMPLLDIIPRNSFSNDAVAQATRTQYNSWSNTRNVADDYVLPYDVSYIFEDPSNPGHMLANVSDDGVHPNTWSGFLFAKKAFDSMSAKGWLPAPIVFPYAKDAASDPTNLLQHAVSDNSANQLFSNTAGAAVNLAAGSVVPSGYTLSADTSWTTSAGAQPSSALVLDDGATLRKKLVITIPNGNAPGSVAADVGKTWLTLTSSTIISSARSQTFNGGATPIVAGNTYRAGIKLKISCPNIFISGLTFRWVVDGTIVNQIAYASSGFSNAGEVFPQGVYDLLTEAFTVPAFLSSIQLSSLILTLASVPGSATGGTIEISAPYIRPYTFLAAAP